MSGRAELVRRAREVLLWTGLALLYAAGVPALAVWLGLGERLPWLVPLARTAPVALAASPFLFILLLYRVWRGMGQRARAAAARLAAEGVTYLLVVDGEAPPVAPERGGDLWAGAARLLARGEVVSFEVVATPEAISFLLTALPPAAETLLGGVAAIWPGTRAHRLAADELPRARLAGSPTRHVTLGPSRAARPVTPAVADPLLTLLGEMARLAPGEAAGLELLVRGDPARSGEMQQQAVRRSLPQLNRYRDYERYRWPWEHPLVTLEDRRAVEELEARGERPILDVRVALWAAGETEDAAASLAHRLASSLAARYGPRNPLVVVGEGAGLPEALFAPFAGRVWTDRELGRLGRLAGAEGVAVAPALEVAGARLLPPARTGRVPEAAAVVGALS